MRSSAVIALFAGSAAAQSTAVLLNPLLPASTFTVLGSSSGTTTYVNSCPESAGIPASFLSTATAGKYQSKVDTLEAQLTLSKASASAAASSSVIRSAGTHVLTPISAPSTTAAARLRRQDNFLQICEPMTLKQGSSSMEIQLEDPINGAWTANANCAWKGELTSADLTCTATQSGAFAKILEAEGVTTVILKASEVADASVLHTVSVVQPASNSASATPSGSQSASVNATASGSSAPNQATGAAAGAPLSRSVMAFVGGAAGIFAAALAL
ncbi:uncharacterized protein EKO05_0008128 [Ascochyta rabiei]|uniref:Uncharacterized protein n=1 Tax=Didymella rabiei TaxID=5454 RepID=A0A163HSM0_DIDRA|nr:uncharacterized protein EKO05_0008128 [Ascochyta rabiei]KZM25445.1 hypothetical protein ST47_g3420 [Ascochyta rabiei]UPX17790.1 hypothetical protein EKO05_0008128 [Ascochyta rabiei]